MVYQKHIAELCASDKMTVYQPDCHFTFSQRENSLQWPLPVCLLADQVR